MAVQDDKRENELIRLFGLKRPANSSRGGLDALLRLGELDVPFELKSTTVGSVTTVRDFGAEHIKKWKGKHWLIGFYDSDGRRINRCLYGSPLAMEPWIKAMEEYIAPDIALAECVPSLVTEQMLFDIVGENDIYSLKDAFSIQKRQLAASEYRARMDLPEGFSQAAMLQLLRERCEYLIERGATLNNPHINAEYFSGKKGPGTDCGPGSWLTLDPRRPEEHLREEVRKALKPPSARQRAEAARKAEELSAALETGEEEP